MTPPHRVVCPLIRFCSAGTPSVGDFPCLVMAWPWMPRNSSRDKSKRRGTSGSSSRRSMLSVRSPPQARQRKSSGEVGDPVWVIRPRPMGTHRTKTWFTPGEVVRRIGEDTYRIKVGHGLFRERHECQLRVREPDLRGQHVSLGYAAHEADSDDDYAEQDDYTVEKILAQRPKASAPGGMEFKVRWRGYGPSHDTWEPVSSFVPRVNTPFMEYIRNRRPRSMSRTWQHSPRRLQPGVPDQRPELSPDAFWALLWSTDRPSLACSLTSSGDLPSEWPYTPPAESRG